ncbi:hypothetical protein QN362_06935 [Actimicrobium sp. CCC2.4]|uniref:hypothetical protein n=1 Tax=Actimicrobium sp. CCC2.4 TaxID=3048606 RepID=UPI002AC9DF86|nr:hypothetical protein [Actimicrobium sp. CCC2.4]MEB0135060.1 hypothetical protein [Actimicrobium sp. CCC2.4]WPX31892.1 hypothetical protein RHM62_16900 [Actimicrobium sp. CCC2.4]
MKPLRTLLSLILLAAMATTAAHADDRIRTTPIAVQTTVIVLPPVVIIGKRLDPAEKNRLAQTIPQGRNVRSTGHKS